MHTEHHQEIHHRKSTKKHRFHWVRTLILSLLGIGIFTATVFFVWAITVNLPDFELLFQRKIAQSTKIYDRTGKIVLWDVHQDVRRTIIPFNQMNVNSKNATVAIEDQDFYQHHGIRPLAIIRAVLANIQSGHYSQGGSTITQQVIKMSLLSSEKTISRKLKEWVLALKLERIMNKEQILELYLNEAPYGGSIYGIEEASLSYFNKHNSELTLAESAYLAALPQAPSYFSPYGSHKEALDSRKEVVLRKMREIGQISESEYQTANAEVVKFQPITDRVIKAPHFVMWIREYLTDKYGEDVVNEEGLRVTTTMNLDMQKRAEEVIQRFAPENEKSFKATNEGMVVIDPKTGQILTMVGSRDYFDIDHEGNFNITTAKRQPGSSFKPFVYAAAFEKGYTPETTVFDLPTQFSTACDAFGNPLTDAVESDCYTPENYDHIFRGPMSLRNALAQSVNVPAVKMLYMVGIDDAIKFARRLGVTGLESGIKGKNRYGLTLVLGGGEVSLLDMTSAYGVFANDGVRRPYTGILRIENSNGEVLEEFKGTGEQVIPIDVARQVSDVLGDNVARSPAFGQSSYLNFPDRQVAVKTGTTNDYKDAWIIGYTPSLVVGAWAGNNNNTAMEKKVAGFIIAPLWNTFFTEELKNLPVETFPKPEKTPWNTKPVLRGIWWGNRAYIVDKVSGMLATEFTPEDLKEERVIPDIHDILHWVDRSDPKGPPPVNPANDAQYLLWDLPVRNWAVSSDAATQMWKPIPTEYDNIHDPANAPKIHIESPNTTQTIFPLTEKIIVNISASGIYPIGSVDFYVNNTLIGNTTLAPFVFSFIPSEIKGIAETNTLRVVARDSMGNTGEETVSFIVGDPPTPTI